MDMQLVDQIMSQFTDQLHLLCFNFFILSFFSSLPPLTPTWFGSGRHDVTSPHVPGKEKEVEES